MAAPIDHATVLLAVVLTMLAGPALVSASGHAPGSVALTPSGMRDNLINGNTPVTRDEMAAYSHELQAVADGFEAAMRQYLQGQCGASSECVAFSISQDFNTTCQDPLADSITGVCKVNSASPAFAGSSVSTVSNVLFATSAMSANDVTPFFLNEYAVNYLNTCAEQTGVVECGTTSVSRDLEDVVVYGLHNQGGSMMDFPLPTNELNRMAVLVGTVQEGSALTVNERPELTFDGGVLACVATHNEGVIQASNMEKLSVKNITNIGNSRFLANAGKIIVMTDVTNENEASIKLFPNTISVANVTNQGKFVATVKNSAHLADFVNENSGSLHLALAEEFKTGSTFSIDTITNAGEMEITGGGLTACGVTNSAGGNMAVLDSAIGTMHILENSGNLNFTGSYGNVVLVGDATMGSVTGDANINWVLGGQDCDVGTSFSPTASPPTNQWTQPPTVFVQDFAVGAGIGPQVYDPQVPHQQDHDGGASAPLPTLPTVQSPWTHPPTVFVQDFGSMDGTLPSEGKSRDGESSSTGYVVAIVLATVAALGLMAVVIRRQAQQSTASRGKMSARVSPASTDGIILTSMDHVTAVENAKTAASAKRATVRVTAIAAAALSSPEDKKPAAATPSSPAPAGDLLSTRRSTRRSSEVITLASTPMSSPMVSRRTHRMNEDIITPANTPPGQHRPGGLP